MNTTTQKEVVIVNNTEMARILTEVKGAVPATVIATTPVKLSGGKKNPYQERVTKRQVSNIFINFDYQKAVNKRLTKEGKEANFESAGRAWGVRVPGTPLIEHKMEHYLEAGFLTKNAPKAEYFLDGEPTDKSLFESYLPAEKEGSGRQGLDEENAVVIRTFKIDNIEELHLNGKIYRKA